MKYSLSSRIIHWIMAVFIIFLLGLGVYMTEFLAKDSPNHLAVYELHKSFGVLAIALIIIRIANRLLKKAPALPESMPKHEIILAHLGHIGLYILMIVVPVSGFLMSNYFGFPVKFFGTELPLIVETNFDHGKIFAELHEIGAYTLIAVVAIHIAAVVKHRFFDKPEHDVLKRMI